MTRETPNADGDAENATRRGLLRAAAGATVAGAASTAGCLSVTTPQTWRRETTCRGTWRISSGRAGSPTTAKTVVLDARDPERFREQRIYRARRVPFDAITAREATDDVGEDVPDTDAIASAFGEIGVTPDDDVLVYGASVGSRHSRRVRARRGRPRGVDPRPQRRALRLERSTRDGVARSRLADRVRAGPRGVDVGHSRVARRPDRDVQRGRSGARRRARAGGVPRRRGF